MEQCTFVKYRQQLKASSFLLVNVCIRAIEIKKCETTFLFFIIVFFLLMAMKNDVSLEEFNRVEHDPSNITVLNYL